MRRGGTRINLIILFVLLGIIGGHFLWGVYVAARLAKTVASLRASGEPLSEADLKVPQLEEAANASLDYLAGAQSIDQNTTAWKTYSDATRAEFRLPLSDNRKATVETIIAENASALSRVKAARGETIGSWNDGNDFAEFSGSVNMRFEPQRRLVTLLTLAALNEHVQTNDRAALDWLKDAIALADASQKRPSLIGHLVANGETEMACECVSERAAEFQVGVNGISRSDLAQLISQLGDEGAMQAGNQLAWRSERILA